MLCSGASRRCGRAYVRRRGKPAGRRAVRDPTVRGVSFGTGFAAAGMRGSEHNDPFVMEHGRVMTRTNHAGGVLGGITTGMPLVVNIAIKPTASIAREQDTVDLETKTNTSLVIHGRHDPCIVPRAVPVVEAVTALTILDMIMED